MIRKGDRLLSSLGSLDGLDQLGNDLEQVTNDTVVSHLEDGSVLVLVHGDDALGVLHTSLVLDGAGDTQGDVDLGMDGLTGLADLVVSSDPAGVHAGTGGAHDAAQNLGQLLSQLDAALDILADATAHGHDEVGTDQVHQLLGSLDGLHHLGLDVAGRQLESGMQDLNLLGAVGAELTLLHNAGAHGGHGGAEAGAEDGGHQVAAESGTGHLDVTGDIVILTVDLHGTQLLDTLLSQRGSLTQEVLVDGHIDVQMGAVGAQTGVQASCAAGSQITADVGGTEQQDLRLDLLHSVGLGGWVTSNVPAHKVWVRNALGEYIPGIVASKPPHYMTEAERKAPLVFENITVDVGAVSKEEAENEFHIRIGEPVVPDVTFTYDEKHDLMVGKSFDCRLGCASIVSTLRELQGEELAVDVVGACCSQEEVGTRGSQVTCRTVNPDIAIVFEGCPADDTCVEAYMVQTAIKKGPMLRHVDARMITNPRYQRYALALAGELGIPVQDAVRSGGSTNGANIHLSGKGVPTIVIGVPVRYAHTHYGISAYADYENGVKLAVEIIKRLNADVIGSF